jgi:hypothetical protein
VGAVTRRFQTKKIALDSVDEAFMYIVSGLSGTRSKILFEYVGLYNVLSPEWTLIHINRFPNTLGVHISSTIHKKIPCKNNRNELIPCTVRYIFAIISLLNVWCPFLFRIVHKEIWEDFKVRQVLKYISN